MAAKAIDKDVAETVIAEWRTGQYSYKQLADRNGISKAKVGLLCKGVEKDMSLIVDAKIQYLSGIDGQDRRIVDAIDDAAESKARLLGLLRTFSENAVIKAGQLLSSTESGTDFKAIVDGVDKVSITANINERHAKPAQISNSANTQINTYASMTKDDLLKEVKSAYERINRLI